MTAERIPWYALVAVCALFLLCRIVSMESRPQDVIIGVGIGAGIVGAWLAPKGK